MNQLDIDSPSLCHGASGLLMCTNALNKKIDNAEIQIFQNAVENWLLNKWEEDYTYLFHNYDVSYPYSKEQNKTKIEDISIISGVTGIILTLMSTQNYETSFWTNIFAI